MEYQNNVSNHNEKENYITICKNSNNSVLKTQIWDNKITEEIIELYFQNPSTHNIIELENKYQLCLYKDSKQIVKIYSYDIEKLEKTLKLVSYRFLNL